MLSAPSAKKPPLLRRTSAGREQLLEVGAVVSGAELNNSTCKDGRTKSSTVGEKPMRKSRKIDVKSKENNNLARAQNKNKKQTNRKKTAKQKAQ